MFNNIRIGRLLSVAFVILIAFFLVVGGFGLAELYRSNEGADSIYSDGLLPVSVLSKLSNNILRVQANYTLMLYGQDTGKFYMLKSEISQWDRKNDELLAQFKSLKLAGDEAQVFSEFTAALTEYRKALGENIGLLQKKDYTGALIKYSELSDKQELVQTLCQQMADINDRSSAKLRNRITANFKNSLYVIAGVIGAALLFAILLSVLIPRTIKRQIGELNELAHRVAQGDVDVNFVSKARNEIGDLAKSFGTVIENLRRLIDEARQLTDSSSQGRFDVRAAADSFGGGYRDILSGVNNTLDTVVEKVHWYESLLDSMSDSVISLDSDLRITFANKSGCEILGASREELFGQITHNPAGVEQLCEQENAISSLVISGHHYKVTTSHLLNAEAEKVGFIEVATDITKENSRTQYQETEVNRLAKNLGLLAQGDLNLDLIVLQPDEYTQADYDNFIKINETFQAAKENLQYYIVEIAAQLASIAGGNFDAEVSGEFKGEFNQMKDSLNQILDSLNDMFRQINQSSGQVFSGAGQVASAAQSLSQGSTEQAAAIEELSATIVNIAAQIKKNAEYAQQAKSLTVDASATLDQAEEQMNSMMKAMQDISDSSQKIGKIIKTIDEIAFQTNILALNAAVEAARAGEAGKGFAVVADEVRALAGKSAEAAKDTALLIENSINMVEKGSRSAQATSDKLTEVIVASTQSGELISLISDASVEQAQAVDQITQSVSQISSVVQTNSATAEESAAASEELSGQADVLNELVGRFKLRV